MDETLVVGWRRFLKAKPRPVYMKEWLLSLASLNYNTSSNLFSTQEPVIPCRRLLVIHVDETDTQWTPDILRPHIMAAETCVCIMLSSIYDKWSDQLQGLPMLWIIVPNLESFRNLHRVMLGCIWRSTAQQIQAKAVEEKTFHVVLTHGFHPMQSVFYY